MVLKINREVLKEMVFHNEIVFDPEVFHFLTLNLPLRLLHKLSICSKKIALHVL